MLQSLGCCCCFQERLWPFRREGGRGGVDLTCTCVDSSKFFVSLLLCCASLQCLHAVPISTVHTTVADAGFDGSLDSSQFRHPRHQLCTTPAEPVRYTISKGTMHYRENITIISEGSGSSSRSSPPAHGKVNKGRGAGRGGGGQAKLWAGRGGGRGGGGGGRFGRPKASSAGAMSNILFRGSTGRVEGRLPREVG